MELIKPKGELMHKAEMAKLFSRQAINNVTIESLLLTYKNEEKLCIIQVSYNRFLLPVLRQRLRQRWDQPRFLMRFLDASPTKKNAIFSEMATKHKASDNTIHAREECLKKH